MVIKVEKTKFPLSVQERVEKFVQALEEDEFFNDPLSFPPNSEEMAKIHLWNFVGEALLSRFIAGSDEMVTEDEMDKILMNTIIQTNLDSLMKDDLIDGIENEHGEMVYWVTDKGKKVYKDETGLDCE